MTPRTDVIGPRDARKLTDPGAWVEAVVSDALKPKTVAEALAIAFTAALSRAMGDQELLALDAGEVPGGDRRAALVRWAAELDMGRESLRMTWTGERWLKLAELERASASAMGPLLLEELTHRLRLVPGVLHTAQDFGPEAGLNGSEGEGWVLPEEQVAVRKKEPMLEPIAVLEARITADVRTLDRRLMAERRAGRPVSTKVDWPVIRREFDSPRVTQPEGHPGMAAKVRAAGVPNLTDLVRAALRGRGEVRSYAIKHAVQQQVTALGGAGITSEQIDNTLARLKRRGEVEHLEHGLYRATDALKGHTRP